MVVPSKTLNADPAHFAGRLKELREENGLTQQQLADAAGLKLGGVRDIEQGINNPTWPTVLALAAALGVSCEDFATPPAERAKAGRGRPRKSPAAATTAERPAGKARKNRSSRA